MTWITLLCGPLGRTKGRTQPTMPQMMVNRSTGTHEAPISIENLFARFYVKWLRFQNRCQNNFVKLPQYFFVCSFSFGSTRFKAESHMREERKARENSNCCFSRKSSPFCTEQISISHATFLRFFRKISNHDCSSVRSLISEWQWNALCNQSRIRFTNRITFNAFETKGGLVMLHSQRPTVAVNCN